jgi:hypothetical protein
MKVSRGPGLLVEHLEGLERLERPRAAARRRLSGLIGSELTRFLMFALASDQRGRWRRRRSSSSP